MTVAIEREGAIIGGVSRVGDTGYCAISCRTNSDGTSLGAELYYDEGFTKPVPDLAVTSAALNSDNNYRGTCYLSFPISVSGMQTFYWRVKAEGVGGPVFGIYPERKAFSPSAGRFKVPPKESGDRWRIGLGGCWRSGLNGIVGINDANRWLNVIWENTINLRLDALGWIGDIIYPDTQTNPGLTGVEYGNLAYSRLTKGAEHTDKTTLPWYRTDWITSLDAGAQLGTDYSQMHVMCDTPCLPMPDDHDWCWNSPGAMQTFTFAWRIQGQTNGGTAAYEYVMDTTRTFVETVEGREWKGSLYTVREPWYYVDYPPARFLFIDCRTYSDGSVTIADATTKTNMLGQNQEEWLIDKIRTCPQPFGVLVSPLAFDGDHDYAPGNTTTENFKGFAYQRDRILNAMNESNAKWVIYSADAHVAFVDRFNGPTNNYKRPIYEFMISNSGWVPSAHKFNTGFSGRPIRPDDTQAATGWGGEVIFQDELRTNILILEGGKEKGKDYLEISVVATYPSSSFIGRLKPEIIYGPQRI